MRAKSGSFSGKITTSGCGSHSTARLPYAANPNSSGMKAEKYLNFQRKAPKIAHTSHPAKLIELVEIGNQLLINWRNHEIKRHVED
jgi:hypothetical protein